MRRYLLLVFATWLVGATVIGLCVALFSGNGGHIPFEGVILMLTVAGAVVGIVGGVAFAPLYCMTRQWLHSPGARTVVTIVIGSLCGVLGVYAVSMTVTTIRYPVWIGGGVGAVDALFCILVATVSRTRTRPA
jgi:hypothetical protein